MLIKIIRCQLGQFGLFGMPIFAGFLVYAIVKFKTFNIKIIGTQALVVSLWVTLIAIIFLEDINSVRIIVSLTLILFLIVGILLIKSAVKEIKQKEEIEKLAEELKKAYEMEKRLSQTFAKISEETTRKLGDVASIKNNRKK